MHEDEYVYPSERIIMDWEIHNDHAHDCDTLAEIRQEDYEMARMRYRKYGKLINWERTYRWDHLYLFSGRLTCTKSRNQKELEVGISSGRPTKKGRKFTLSFSTYKLKEDEPPF